MLGTICCQCRYIPPLPHKLSFYSVCSRKKSRIRKRLEYRKGESWRRGWWWRRRDTQRFRKGERRKKIGFFLYKSIIAPPHFFPYLLLNLNVMQFGDKYHRTCILQMLQTISTILCVPWVLLLPCYHMTYSSVTKTYLSVLQEKRLQFLNVQIHWWKKYNVVGAFFFW